MDRNIPSLDIGELTKGDSKNWNAYDFFVTEVSIHNLLRYSPVRQKCYQVAVCTSGYNRVRINGKEILYTKNTIAAFTPSSVFEVIEVSKDYECHTVIFHRNFLTETLNNIYFLERFHLLNDNGLTYLEVTEDDAKLLSDHLSKMREKQKDKNNPFRRDIMRSLIIILLYETENILTRQKTEQVLDRRNGKEKILSDFKDLLSKNFYIERKISFYSSSLKITTAKLTQVVRQFTGRSPKEHIEEMIITQAKIYLQSGKYNISEVASLLYYNNLEEFSRFFKKKTGFTALAFSKSI